MRPSSDLPGFYRLAPEERLKVVAEFAALTSEEVRLLRSTGSLRLEEANRMIENVIGAIPVPLGIAVNFLIDGRDYLIPMATEEPSIVAAASNASKMARSSGGFFTDATDPVMMGQIQVVNMSDPNGGRIRVLASRDEILKTANDQDPLLLSLGGGAKDVNARVIRTSMGPMLIVDLYVDCRDAMGANVVNTMSEAVAPIVELITGGKVHLRIVSNLPTGRLARARVVVAKKALGGEKVVDGIISAYAFAAADIYRCATHNKGIMNGMTAVALATGNDTRALEAGAHAYAARSGKYSPLSVWEKNENKDLVGSIELPAPLGLIGGATAVHPICRIALKILGIKSAVELGRVMAAVGLAQNLAALRALATEGIQKGHMKLHARNLAATAGAEGKLIDKIAETMVKEGRIRFDRARQLLEELGKQKFV